MTGTTRPEPIFVHQLEVEYWWNNVQVTERAQARMEVREQSTHGTTWHYDVTYADAKEALRTRGHLDVPIEGKPLVNDRALREFVAVVDLKVPE